jgi:hypothetical protein
VSPQVPSCQPKDGGSKRSAGGPSEQRHDLDALMSMMTPRRGRLFTMPLPRVITGEERKGTVMKINQLGTLAIIGVVIFFTAACNGSPTKPTALTPSLGDGASAASVNLSNPKTVAATDQLCTTPPQTFVEGEDQHGELPPADAPPVTCDSSAAADQSQADVVMSDAPPMDSARSVHRLRR